MQALFATFAAATTPVPVMPSNHAVQDYAVELFLVTSLPSSHEPSSEFDADGELMLPLSA